MPDVRGQRGHILPAAAGMSSCGGRQGGPHFHPSGLPLLVTFRLPGGFSCPWVLPAGISLARFLRLKAQASDGKAEGTP